MINNTKTNNMNAEQLIGWVKGFTENKNFLSEDDLKTLKEKLEYNYNTDPFKKLGKDLEDFGEGKKR